MEENFLPTENLENSDGKKGKREWLCVAQQGSEVDTLLRFDLFHPLCRHRETCFQLTNLTFIYQNCITPDETHSRQVRRALIFSFLNTR